MAVTTAPDEPDDVEEKIIRLRLELERARRGRRTELAKRIGAAAVIALFFGLGMRELLPMLGILAIFGGSALLDITAAWRLRDAASEAAKLEDPRVIEVLFEALHDRDGLTRAISKTGLTRSLPTLTEYHNPPPRIVREIGELAPCDDVDLARSCLTALTEVGNAQSLDVVRRMANLETGNFSVRWQLVGEAKQAEAAIVARLDARRKRDTLLRPSESTGQELLRPVEASQAVEADQLLRAPSTDPV